MQPLTFEVTKPPSKRRRALFRYDPDACHVHFVFCRDKRIKQAVDSPKKLMHTSRLVDKNVGLVSWAGLNKVEASDGSYLDAVEEALTRKGFLATEVVGETKRRNK